MLDPRKLRGNRQVLMLLELTGINKTYSGRVVLDDVSFAIDEGEIVGLIGPNASGKTTLGKIIAGTVRPSSGNLRINGNSEKFYKPLDAIRKGMFLVSQEDRLFAGLSVAENITIGEEKSVGWGFAKFINPRATARMAQGVLSKLNSKPIPLRQNVSNLSGGQKKIVAIARVLLKNPRLVVFDEASNSLGVYEQRWLSGIFKTLSEFGVAVLVISHNPREVLDVTNRVVVLREGRKVGDQNTVGLHIDQIESLMMGRIE